MGDGWEVTGFCSCEEGVEVEVEVVNRVRKDEVGGAVKARGRPGR